MSRPDLSQLTLVVLPTNAAHHPIICSPPRTRLPISATADDHDALSALHEELEEALQCALTFAERPIAREVASRDELLAHADTLRSVADQLQRIAQDM